MRVISISEGEYNALARLKRHAEDKVYSVDDMLDVINGDLPIPGDNPDFVVELPSVGHRVVYTVEDQPQHGLTRHLSISNYNDIMPELHVARVVMRELGFISDIVKLTGAVWFTTESFEDRQAINIYEPFNESDIPMTNIV